MNARLRPVPAVAPRAVLYLRQSVARDDSISIELQEIAGRDYCAAHGYEVVAVEVDEGISGRTWSKRPAVQRVMEMIEARDADVIILWKWSRLSRTRKDWAIAADRVDVAGGRIESATEPIDTATASGRFARGVMTEYAAFQSEQIGEQWAEVRARRFNLGLPPHGAVPWGWLSRRTHIEPHPEQSPYVPKMYQMYIEGRGATTISAWLNREGVATRSGKPWVPTTVKRLLNSPIHAGYVEYRGEVREGAHDGIISESTWARYQQAREGRSVPMRARRSTYLLSSLLVCHCGRKRFGCRSGSSDEGRYSSYACPSTVPHPAGTKSIATHRVDRAISDWIKSEDITAAIEESVKTAVDVEAIAREITVIEKRLVKLTEHLVSGLVPEQAYRATREKLESDAAALTEEMGRARLSRMVNPRDYLAALDGVRERWDGLPLEEKRALLRTLVLTITVRDDMKVEVMPTWGEPVVIDL